VVMIAGALLIRGFPTAFPLEGPHGEPGPGVLSLFTVGVWIQFIVLAAAAATVGALRRRGPWGGALFGALLLTLTLLVAPGAAALPLVGAAWVSALLLALEPGPRRPLPAVFARVRRIPLRKPRLRLLAGS